MSDIKNSDFVAYSKAKGPVITTTTHTHTHILALSEELTYLFSKAMSFLQEYPIFLEGFNYERGKFLSAKLSHFHKRLCLFQLYAYPKKNVLASADKAANNVVVVWRLYYVNTLIQELGSTKTYEWISTDERSIVNTHSVGITAKFAVSIKEKQDRLPTLYWLPKLHKRSYKARFIANSSSCTTTVLSKLLTSCLTAVKNIGLDTMILFTKGTELTIFGQLKIQMMFSINLNLKTFRLLNCLHMIFLHCILRYLIIL